MLILSYLVFRILTLSFSTDSEVRSSSEPMVNLCSLLDLCKMRDRRWTNEEENPSKKVTNLKPCCFAARYTIGMDAMHTPKLISTFLNE